MLDKDLKFEPSEELAYLVGAIQSDGSYHSYDDRGITRIRVSFHVSGKSLPMLIKVKEISEKLFLCKRNIYERKDQGGLVIFISLT